MHKPLGDSWGAAALCGPERYRQELLLSCFIMYFSLELRKEYKPHMQESLGSGAATQIMETLVSYQNIGRKLVAIFRSF